MLDPLDDVIASFEEAEASAPMREVVRPKIEAAAIEEGKKLGYTERDCAKEK